MLKIEKYKSNLLVYLAGALTYENTTEVKEEIKAHISSDITKIILELSKLDLIDSSGVGVFISLLKRMDGEGVLLAAPQPRVGRIFEITKLNQIMPIFATLEEALKK